MTAPLRRAHLLWWLVLSAVMWIVFAAGLSMRRDNAPLNPDLHWERVP